MEGLKELADFMYGDGSTRRGFWYSNYLNEIEGLTEDQLFWTPASHALCPLWHVGHIAHREQLHIGVFLQGLPRSILPAEYEVFGTEWFPVEDIRRSVGCVERVLAWAREVRDASSQYIASLEELDFFRVPPTSEFGFSIAHWLFITACHTSLHLGRIQLLVDLLYATPERAC